jgi:PleD family two-component response regulator
VDILRSRLGALAGVRPAQIQLAHQPGWRAESVATRAQVRPVAQFTRSDDVAMSPTIAVRTRRPAAAPSRHDDLPFGPDGRPIATATRILLAVGDLAQGMMIRRALESDGHEVASAQSGRDTVLALIAAPADVLLINAPLSDGSAAALLRWTRSRSGSAHMTCMVMVPPGDARVIATLYDAGADFVITRTTELDLLSRKVAAALARRPVALAS